MFRCERCGTGFNPTVAATLACCPRCRARDGVSATVALSLFEAAGRMPAGDSTPEDEAGSAPIGKRKPVAVDPPSRAAG